jgi:beta-galactosidase GanA
MIRARVFCSLVALKRLRILLSNRQDLYGDHSFGSANVPGQLETAIQLDILDPKGAAFSGYKTLVLPNGFAMDTSLKTKLEEFIARGSKLVMSGTAALHAASGKFVLEGVPVTFRK